MRWIREMFIVFLIITIACCNEFTQNQSDIESMENKHIKIENEVQTIDIPYWNITWNTNRKSSFVIVFDMTNSMENIFKQFKELFKTIIMDKLQKHKYERLHNFILVPFGDSGLFP